MQGDYAWYYAIVDVPPTQTYTVTLNPYGVAKVDLYATTDGRCVLWCVYWADLAQTEAYWLYLAARESRYTTSSIKLVLFYIHSLICSRPSATNFQFGSFKTNGPEQLTISPGMIGYNNSCILRVAVHHPFIDQAGYDVT